MSRATKIAVGSGAGFLGVLAVLVAALFIIPNTDSGRTWIAGEVNGLTHGQVRLQGIHGSFPAALDLDRVELRDSQGLWLWAEHASLRWSPSALLTRHIDVTSLHLALLHVERLPVPDTNQKPSTFKSVPHTDVQDLTINTFELGKALAGDPASLTVKATAHVRSLQDADTHWVVRRIAGDGTYQLDAHFDPRALNTTLKLQEPAQGPLEHLLKVPDVGALSAWVSFTGPRNAEDLHLSIDAGPLQARASGRLDLTNGAADLNYSLTAPQMSPNPQLRWQKIELQGRLSGPFKRLAADGHLLVKALQVPGGARLAGLEAHVKGDQGSIALEAGIDGLEIPGPAPQLFRTSRLTVDGALRLDDPRRPLQLTARHALFSLEAKAETAGSQSADLVLHVPDLTPFSALAGTRIAGDAQMAAHLDYTQSLSKLTANLSTHLNGGEAAWSGPFRNGLTQLQMVVELTDQEVSVKQLRLTAPTVSLTADAQQSRTGEQRIKAHFDLGLADLHRISPALVGDLKVTGTVEGPSQKLRADTQVTTTVSVHGSPRGTVSAHLQAQGLPQ
jgi:hypothetical protein